MTSPTHLTLDDADQGGPICLDCGNRPCPRCHGDGVQRSSWIDNSGVVYEDLDGCERCDGGEPCPRCRMTFHRSWNDPEMVWNRKLDAAERRM